MVESRKSASPMRRLERNRALVYPSMGNPRRGGVRGGLPGVKAVVLGVCLGWGGQRLAGQGTAVKQALANDAGAATQTITNPLPALPVSIWSKAGTRVTGVQFEGVRFGANDRLLGELKQKAGTPLDPEAVRADLRRLFTTGRYRDIAVYGRSEGAGLELVYDGVAQYFVGRVTIVGVKSEQLTSLLEFATRLEPGTPFSEEQIPAAEASMHQTLERNGFYLGVVTVQEQTDTVNHEVNATFTVDVGVQARVGDVAVAGPDAGISVEDFRKKGGLNCSRVGLFFNHECRAKVNRNTVDNALSGVRGFYEKEGHLEGKISLQDSTFMASRKQLDYKFGADQGPVVSVTVSGAKISRGKIKLLVPVYEEGAVDNDLLNEGLFNIQDYEQQRGYFDVKDTVQLLGKGTKHITVQYDVTLGIPHKVTAVLIKGNHYFDNDTLEELLHVKKADSYQRSGKYSAALVNADVNSMEALYRSNGFTDVKVTPQVTQMDKGKDGRPLKEGLLRVVFHVEEGTQEKFGTVEVKGVAAEREGDIEELLSSKRGQPFSFVTLSGDRDAILNYYISHGFEHARIEIAQQVVKGDKPVSNVTLKVTEGSPVFIDKVLLTGLEHTRPKVVQSSILVKAGDPLNQAALLQTQRNLYNLALFTEVNTAVQDPDGEVPAKDVLVQITEAKRWDVTYGFGFEAQSGTPAVVPGETRGTTAAQNGKAGASPRVSLDVSRINLKGSQDSLTLHATYGLLEEVATLSFNNPRLLGRQNFTGTVAGGYSNVQDISTFASSTLQGDLRVTQKSGRADTFIYDFQYRRVSIDQSSLEITPNLISQLSEPVIVGGPQFTYIHDTRDPTPLNAGKGQYFSFQQFLASSGFGSGTNFSKTDISQSTYYTFGKRKFVFARNLRVGFEEPWGANPNAVDAGGQIGVSSTACAGTLLQTNPTCYAVPLPERLYAGGASSHRGFGINDAGPRDLTTGYPVGGPAVVVNSFELRLPPPTLPLVGDSVSFVLFHDMGNVFQYQRDMFSSIKNFRQPNRGACRDLMGPLAAANGQADNAVGSCNFNYYSHAVGLGVRYNTPVGPLRVDFSYNLNPPIYPVFDDYTGVPPYVGEGSHFNFFFSIGQSF